MKRLHDIDRLERVHKHLEKVFNIMYHMDEREYSRAKDYIYSRHSILFPAKNPGVAVEPTLED